MQARMSKSTITRAKDYTIQILLSAYDLIKFITLITYRNPLIAIIFAYMALSYRALFNSHSRSMQHSLIPAINHNYMNNTCAAPDYFITSNKLTIYSTNEHFFSELICNSCDDGKFYFDKHGIYYDIFGPSGQKTGTLRDDYTYSKKHRLRFFSLELTDKQASDALNAIRTLNKKIHLQEITYSLVGFNCIDYTQLIYKAAGGDGFITDKLGVEYLTGSAGAFAFLKQHPLSTTTIFKSLQIFLHKPDPQVSVEYYDNNVKSCNRRSGDNLFQPVYPCLETPSGNLIPVDYEPSYTPDCEVRDNKFVYNVRKK